MSCRPFYPPPRRVGEILPATQPAGNVISLGWGSTLSLLAVPARPARRGLFDSDSRQVQEVRRMAREHAHRTGWRCDDFANPKVASDVHPSDHQQRYTGQRSRDAAESMFHAAHYTRWRRAERKLER